MTTTTDSGPANSESLQLIWQTFQEANPQARIRDAAAQLGVSEVELVATSCGEGVVRLAADWDQFIHRLEKLGPVMALTRNEHAVSEKYGTFGNIKFNGPMGLVLNEDIDLRLFIRHWHSGFGVETSGQQGPLRSLQFFDAFGTAIHKVYLTEASDLVAYNQLIKKFASDDQAQHQSVEPIPAQIPDRPDSTIDIAGLETAWIGLEDIHDFRHLLQRSGVGRVQALRLVDDELACRVPTSGLSEVLHMVSQYQLAIMVFVGSPGVIQIHSGSVSIVKASGPWINVLDDGFNLHVREDQIASAWVVRKPTRGGVVLSLELYDDQGETIALLFAKRKEGQAASEAWQTVLATLTSRPCLS